MLEARLVRLQRDYESQLQHWSDVIQYAPLREQLIDKSAPPARRFFKLAFEEFLPLVRENRYEEAQLLANGPMLAAYNEHHSFIGKIVELCREKTNVIEHETAKKLASDFVPLLFAMKAFLLGTTLTAVIWNLSTSRKRAVLLAQSMTSNLCMREKELNLAKELAESASRPRVSSLRI